MTGFPVEFRYPTVTTLVPANIAIVKDAPHPENAAAFNDFLLSAQGQDSYEEDFVNGEI